MNLEIENDGSYLDFIYDVYGTGLESADVCAAVLGIYMRAQKDVWKAVKMGASIGGDTDTIASLAGALCASHSGCHNIPQDIINKITKANKLDFDSLAVRVFSLQESYR
jgi:ADP-ribosylglycohydrolase